MKFEIIYADPPWNYKSNGNTGDIFSGNKITSNVDNHYETMKTEDIMKLDIPSISSKDCLLYMWVTNPFLEHGIKLMNAWGFKFTTVGFVWNKQRVMPGFYTMSQCELVIIGKKGKIPIPRGARNIKQYLEEKRTVHSKKPDEIRKRIEELHPTQTKIELFTREKHEGWVNWGNEIESDIQINWRNT